MCDQISDKILDECLKQDKHSRVAIETLGGHGIITVTGELTTNAYVDIAKVVRAVYADIGYKNHMGVQVNIVSQSRDIAQGVDTGGAGDQGAMVAYACNENKAMIPHELYLARKITMELEKLQDEKILPDGKAQVTLAGNKIIRLVASNQTLDEKYLRMKVRREILPLLPLAKNCKVFINPTGKFLVGGFDADTGLTGRKIIVDAYGPRIPVGGGCQSGKDPSKVDRSAAYMGRKVAVDLLRKHKAAEVLVNLAYCIGRREPMMATANITYKDGTVYVESALAEKYDLTPAGIIKRLNLMRPIFYRTAQHGHFGHFFPWEK